MAADHSAALWALPFLSFLCEKCLNSVVSDAYQVFDHAQVIARAVTFIKRFQAFAGELLALKTKAHFPLRQQSAIHKQAVLPARDAARAAGLVEPLFVQFVDPRLVADAHAAIHPAGCDQELIHIRSFLSPHQYRCISLTELIEFVR